MQSDSDDPNEEVWRTAVAADVVRRFDAEPGSVTFIKARRAGRHHGYAVEFHGLPFPSRYQPPPGNGAPKGAMSAFYSVVVQDSGTLFFAGVSARQGSRPAHEENAEPVLSLHGSSNPIPCIGGVLQRDTTIRSVRVADSRGEVLEDDVLNGYVLFVCEQTLINPLYIRLYNWRNELHSEIERSF